MAPQSLEPWLSRLLQHEISAVLHWWSHRNPNLKPDPECRFQNDFSNFRSVVSTLPAHKRVVQLVEVLSLGSTPRVVLSDGERKVKARLFPDAIDVLQKETGEIFGFDVTGDVFHLRAFTVVSTHLGTSDDSVTLAVDGIEYAHHLRRSQGIPVPIEEDKDIALLINEMKEVRSIAIDSAGAADVEDSAAGHVPAVDSDDSVVVLDTSPVHEIQGRSSVLRSYSPVQRKRQAPSLDKDGFTVETGLNLDLPFQGTAGLSRHKRLPGGQADDANLERRKQHLSALFKPPPGPRASEDGQSILTQRATEVINETPAKDVTLPGRADPGQSHDGGHETTNRRCSSSSPTAQRSASKPPSTQLVQAAVVGLEATSSSQDEHRRRKIPAAQWKLLERKDSWMPPLPGQRFPHPNVPIELLTEWNKSLAKTPPPVESATANVDAQTPFARAKECPGSPRSSIESFSDASDDELPASQWPLTPQHNDAGLPPHSSLETGDDLRVEAPRIAVAARGSPKLGHEGQSLVPSKTMRHALLTRSEVETTSSTQQLSKTSGPMLTQRQSARRADASSPTTPSRQPPSPYPQSQVSLPESQRLPRGSVTPSSPSVGSKRPRQSISSPSSIERRQQVAKPEGAHFRPLAYVHGTDHQHTSDVDRRRPRQAQYDQERPHSRSSYTTDDVRTDPAGYRRRSALDRGQLDRDHRVVRASCDVGESYVASYPEATAHDVRLFDRDHRSSTEKPATRLLASTPPKSRIAISPRATISSSDARHSFDGRSKSPRQQPTDARSSGRQRISQDTPLSQWRNPSMVGRRSSQAHAQASPSDGHADQQTERPRNIQEPLSTAIDRFKDARVKPQPGPEALPQQNPDQVHRRTRREFLHRQRRSDWLKNQYYPSASGVHRFQHILAVYRATHKHDQVAAPEFMDAVRVAFPASDATLATTFVVRDRGQSEFWPTPPVRSGESTYGQMLDSNQPSSPQADELGSSPPIEYDGEFKLQEKRSVIQEFCEVWLNMRPGGAFAQVPLQKRSRRSINVLWWNI